MSLYDSHFFARGFAAIGHYEASLKPHERAAARDVEERRLVKVPKLHDKSFAFAPVMLKSGLFRPASGARTVYATFTPIRTHGPHQIELEGEELRQDDERVLMAFLKARAGEVVDGSPVAFVPRTFCREQLGWADSSDSVAKLRKSITRLHTARVRVLYADGGVDLYSFVSDASLTGDKWEVWLSPRLAQMFSRPQTYLHIAERLRLKDGLASWLYGFIKADACAVPFALADLRALAGSTYEQKDWNKAVRKVLAAFVADGIIRSFSVASGKLKVEK